MSKEWGTESPNLSNFVAAVPTTYQELLASLQKLAENWAYVDKIGVVRLHKAIMVDLGAMANSCKEIFGKTVGGCTPDFYIPLKISELDKADTLVKALVAKADLKKPIVEKDAIDLFATIQTAQ